MESQPSAFDLDKIRSFTTLRSPFLLSVVDAFEDNLFEYAALTRPGIALEVFENEMKEKHKTWSEERLWRFIAEMAEALCTLHSQNIIHNRIYKTHVFVFHRKHFQLSGYSEFLPCYSNTASPNRPPEWADNAKGSPQTDIWMLGALIAQLISGDSADIAHFELPSYFSESFHSLIASMLNVDPSKRITAQEVLQIPEASQALIRSAEHLAISTIGENFLSIFSKSGDNAQRGYGSCLADELIERWKSFFIKTRFLRN